MKKVQKIYLIVMTVFYQTAALANTYTYGDIPLTATLCTTHKVNTGIVTGISFQGGLSGELGGGWEKAVHVAAKIPVAVTGAIAYDLGADANIYTENCLEVINTLDPVDISTLPAKDKFLLDTLLLSALGERLDTSKLALDLIKHGVNNNVSLGQSRAIVATYGQTVGEIVDLIVKPKVLTIEELLANLVHSVDNLSDVLPAPIKQALLHPDRVFVRHLKNIDLIGQSCADLDSGRITHFPAELKAQVDLFCSNLSFIKTEGLAFLNTIPDSVKAIGTVTNSVVELGESVDTAGFVVGQVNKSIDKVRNSTDKVISDIKIVVNTMNRVGKKVEKSINDAKATIDSGISQVSVVTDDVKTIGNDIKIIADESRTFLVDDIQTNVSSILTASNTLVTRTITTVMTPVCNFGAKFGFINVTVKSVLSALNGDLQRALCP